MEYLHAGSRNARYLQHSHVSFTPFYYCSTELSHEQEPLHARLIFLFLLSVLRLVFESVSWLLDVGSDLRLIWRRVVRLIRNLLRRPWWRSVHASGRLQWWPWTDFFSSISFSFLKDDVEMLRWVHFLFVIVETWRRHCTPEQNNAGLLLVGNHAAVKDKILN